MLTWLLQPLEGMALIRKGVELLSKGRTQLQQLHATRGQASSRAAAWALG